MSEDCNPGPSLRWGELYVSTQSQMTARSLKLGRAALNETRKGQRCSLPRNVPNLFLLEAPVGTDWWVGIFPSLLFSALLIPVHMLLQLSCILQEQRQDPGLKSWFLSLLPRIHELLLGPALLRGSAGKGREGCFQGPAHQEHICRGI